MRMNQNREILGDVVRAARKSRHLFQEALAERTGVCKRTIQAQIADGVSFADIATRHNIGKRTIRLCISKFKEGGIDAALFDAKRLGRFTEISDDAKAWIINIAYQRPAELGYSQEFWTLAKIHKHIHPNRPNDFLQL